MLYNKLLSLKSKYTEIDNEKFKSFVDIVNKSNIKFKVILPNKVNLKSKKNNFNIILNKITLDNYQEILMNEILNKNINLNNVDNLINMIIDKVVSDGKFIECNVKFLIDLIRLLNNNSFDYLNLINEKLNLVINEDNEMIKENYYNFITVLVNNNFFNKEIIVELIDHFKNNDKYHYDLYLILNNNKYLLDENKDLIQNKINECKDIGNLRYVTLYENLFNIKVKKDKKIIPKNDDKLKSKCENIIKEYILIEDLDEIKYHLEENNNNEFKNKFLYCLIYEILISEDKDVNKLYNLMKSNIFKSELKINDATNILNNFNEDEIFLDYNEKKNKIINLLK